MSSYRIELEIILCLCLLSLTSGASLQRDRWGRTTKEEAGIFMRVWFPTFPLIGSQRCFMDGEPRRGLERSMAAWSCRWNQSTHDKTLAAETNVEKKKSHLGIGKQQRENSRANEIERMQRYAGGWYPRQTGALELTSDATSQLDRSCKSGFKRPPAVLSMPSWLGDRRCLLCWPWFDILSDMMEPTGLPPSSALHYGKIINICYKDIRRSHACLNGPLFSHLWGSMSLFQDLLSTGYRECFLWQFYLAIINLEFYGKQKMFHIRLPSPSN